MPYRRTEFKKGYYYHIYNRGVNGQKIFREADNYRFLLQRVREIFARDCIVPIAYCLMPNHYHFLLRQDSDIPISKSIHSVFNSYSKAFNLRYNRSGTLFEDRFKSILVDKEEYLIHLCRYIHCNPVGGKKPLVLNLEQWTYSNYPEWIEVRNGELVDREFIRTYFPTREDYKEFVFDYHPSERLMEELGVYFFD